MPTTRNIRLVDLEREIENFSSASLDEMRAATVRGVVRSLPELVQNSPVDTGQYAASWDFQETEQSVILGNFAPHAAIIENGARPFTPPIGPLLAWAKRVLKDGSQPPDFSPAVRSLAYGVQKKISKVGMAPRKILEKAIPMIIRNIKLEFERIA